MSDKNTPQAPSLLQLGLSQAQLLDQLRSDLAQALFERDAARSELATIRAEIAEDNAEPKYSSRATASQRRIHKLKQENEKFRLALPRDTSFRFLAQNNPTDGELRYMGFTKRFEILWVVDPKQAILFTEARANQAIEEAVAWDKRNKNIFTMPALVLMGK